MKPANSVLSSYGTTIFTVMSALSTEHGAINLGQGFPDEEGPEEIRRAAAEAVIDGPNQYPPMLGLPELRQAVADHNRRFYGLDVDWRTEVMVTSGATEALADCFLGLIEPGDEVILIEPLYDSYLPMVRRAGATPKLVRMQPPDWTLPRAALAAAFSEKTKLVVLNSPHNPAGKVFDREELSFIAGLVEKFDAYAVCDEVYEHLVFGGRAHVPLMTLPSMRERCLRIGSAGKTFSATGWKVGYVTAAPHLLTAVAKAHQFVTFTTPPNLQRATAFGLNQDDGYFRGLAADQQAKRDRLARGLESAGLVVLESAGTYFLVVDIRSVGFNGDDVAFCRQITTQAGVAAVPVSAFYRKDGQGAGEIRSPGGHGHGGADASDGVPDRFARFCFCKRPEILDEAGSRLKRHFAGACLALAVGLASPASAQDIPEKDIPEKDIPEKDIPEKDIPESVSPSGTTVTTTRHLTVGVAAVPPYAIEAAEGSWDGIAIHLWREIASDLNVTYDLRAFDRAALIDQVAGGTLDLALTTVATAEDARRVDFAQPYHVTTLGVARQRLDTLGSIAKRLFTMRFLNIVLWLSALLLVVGFLAWLLERKSNPEQFGGGGRTVRGIGDGFWWAGVTMTTIGYGDKAPVTLLGRALALLWMLVAMGVTASLTAALVSVVGAGPASVKVPDDLRGMAVGVIADTAAAEYLDDEQIRYQAFDTAASGIRAVREGEIEVLVHGAPELIYRVQESAAHTLLVSSTRAAPQPFAFTLPEGSDLREPLDRLVLEKTSGSAWQSLLDRYMPDRGSS